MACGKPVITTDWSGSTDFADASTSFPVAYELTTITRTVGPYRAGEVWAEPDVDHAAELMRQVAANPATAARRGAAAAQRMHRDYSSAAIADLVRMRLDAIGSRDRLRVLRAELSTFADDYRALVRRIRQIASRVAPPGAIVAVVSRGDDDLLDLGSSFAWHFPEARPGVYAGHHPVDSVAAIAELEAARTRGAEFLLFPGTALWWLDHYDGFCRHLDAHYTRAWRDEQCVIYDLRPLAQEASA
jgi:hypothetical protein